MNKSKDDHTEINSTLKLFVKSSFFILIGIIFSKIFTYLYKVVTARSFGPDIYGILSLAVAVSGFFSILAGIGLNPGIVRFISMYRGNNDQNKIRYVYRFVKKIQLITSILFGILLFVSAKYISITFFHNPGLIIFLKFFSVVVPLNAILLLFLAILKSFEKINWFSFIFNILQNAIKLVTLMVFIFLGFKINAVIFSYILGFLISLLVAYMACRFLTKSVFIKEKLDKKTKKQISKEILAYSWPLLFSGLIYSLFSWTDSFAIGFLKTIKEVGFYNSAIPVSMLLILTSELFTHLFFPLVTREYAKNKKNIIKIKQISQQIGKWIFALNLPLLILILIFPGFFINFLFGEQYLMAENALRFLTIGFFFSSIFAISSNLLSMAGKSKIILFDTGVITLLNIVLNFLLIPLYGITGAAISTMISLILLNLLFFFQAKYYLSIIPLRRKVLRIFGISIVPTILLVVIKSFIGVINPFKMILLGIIYFSSYVSLILLTSSLDRNDLMILRTIKEKLFPSR